MKGDQLKERVAAKTPNTKTTSPSSRIRKTGSPQANSPWEHILHLHQTVGNQAVQKLFKSAVIQGKLNIGQPNDIYEQEADRVADQVMWMPDNTAISDQGSAIPGGNDHIRTKPS